MPHANAAYMTTTTTGPGDLALAAVTGNATIFDALGALNRRFPYAIVDDTTGALIEEGIGYLSASTTLVRAKVLATYSGGTYDDTSPTAVSLAAGTKRVVAVMSADTVLSAWPIMNRNAALNLQKFVHSGHLSCHSSSSSGFTAVANRLYFMPFELKVSADIDALGVRCGTGVASTNVRLGIYDVDENGHPATLLASTGALSTATSSTDVIGTVTQIRLQPGVYFTALVSDGAPGLGRMDGGGCLGSLLGPGASNLANSTIGFWASYTFAALPSTAPTTGFTTLPGGNAVPTILARTV